MPTAAAGAGLDPATARAAIRAGTHSGPTSGLAPGFAQANLVVLPQREALDFLRFCVRNPAPCPLLAVTDTGSPYPDELAVGADLRTDVPRYRVFEGDRCIDEPADIHSYWREDLVAFLLGCSFTFEWALTAAGLPLAHQAQGKNVPMYITDRPCARAGKYAGPLVVSMRPFPADDVPRAVEITSRFPAMHGGPVHIGDPAALGIANLNEPDFGESVAVGTDEIPVFWACGVTPQAVAHTARPSLAIFHSPGHMFVTDIPHEDFDAGDCATYSTSEKGEP
jgi:uncharacterized protein YcsI (UPF0317 family)